jgi:hypothetical protein
VALRLTARPELARRSLLASLACWLVGCPSAAVVPEHEPPAPLLPDLEVARLVDLLTSASLEWLVVLRPAELARLEWLKPSLARVFKDERLDALAKATGVQLRDTPELALASYRDATGDSSIAYFLRHASDPLLLERKFRERLTSGEERNLVGHQLLAMWGLIGRAPHGFVSVGPHVVGYQYGGDRKRGPARIALLYAQGKLGRIPAALADPPLAALDQRITAAPVQAFFPGPFEGELARGARGLFGAATAVALALRPTPARSLGLEILVGGEFPAEDAPRYLEGAFADLGKSDLGHLLGLGTPVAPVVVAAARDALSLRTELDAAALLAGLSAATSENVREIMM